jgi:thiamine-monophosphate kinase
VKGEDRFVEKLRMLLPGAQRAVLGPGDDAAVVAAGPGPIVATTDLVVENVDFLSGEQPEAIGRRALAVNLSDLAAMGARPEFFLLSIGFRSELGEEFPLGVARGALSRATPLGVELVGGDLSDAPSTVVSVALWGSAEGEPLTRSGARPGDWLFLSGWPGRAAAGLRLSRRLATFASQGSAPTPRFVGLSLQDEAELLAAYRDPEPRIELGLFLARERIAHAAIDVSDGMGVDAARLARASGARAVLERERIPIHPALASFAEVEAIDAVDWILAGGDDYELLFAAPPEAAPRLAQVRPEWGAPVTRVGQIEEGSGAVLRDRHGDRDVGNLGHDHLMGSP